MDYRFATKENIDRLADWNHALIRDEGHRNSMSLEQLRKRMTDWISGGYTAVLFGEAADPVAYALYREDLNEIHLRQFFVRPERRREGIGRKAVSILRENIWPMEKRLTVDVLTSNAPAVAFWRTVGYKDYCMTLELIPKV